ncbi:MAG: aromatic ring-hydroxylating dioxygenase subunit alpha [Myxococcaceae bacterium]|nr:aromatic ring-hydroxylating dioxygenase subunit alpha [Myxococcaceae bacterium]
MFEGFANVWTPVALSSRLKVQKTLSVVLAGEPLALFRDARGEVGALIDRCPHRGVKLSLGQVTPDGCLECPFHAWRFDKEGRVCEVPLNPDAKRERLFANAVPARDIGGLIWVFTALGARAPNEPTVPDGLTHPDYAKTYLQVDWKAHWTRAMENMLDSPHVPFLHRKTIGRFVRPKLKPGSRMDIVWEETPYGGRTHAGVDGDFTGGAYLDFYKPNVMVLNIPVPGKVFRMHAVCVPKNAQETSMIVVGTRSFATLALLNPFFNRNNMKIVLEDQAVVESSFPVEIPPAAQEKSVRTDKATLQFRRYYYEQLKNASAPVQLSHGPVAAYEALHAGVD